MASDRDIDGNIEALAEAIKIDNEEVGLTAAKVLVGGLLKDIARIADALEYLAMCERDKMTKS